MKKPTLKIITIELNEKFVLHSQGIKYRTYGEQAMSYATAEYTQFKSMVAREVKRQIGDLFFELNEPISLDINYYYQIPKSYNKSKRDKLGMIHGKPKLSSPDVDNLSKTMLDAMSGVLYRDDKQVYNLNVNKLWADLSAAKMVIQVVVYNHE